MEIRESEARRRPTRVSNVNDEQIYRSFLAALGRRRVFRERLSRISKMSAGSLTGILRFNA
jgi:hypothetical protein